MTSSLQNLLQDIKSNKVKNWGEVHSFYQQNGESYAEQKWQHAYASLLEISGLQKLEKESFSCFLDQALKTKEWMTNNIYTSRAKDYQSEFRKMIYDNEKEMVSVIGNLEDNVFINKQKNDLETFKGSVAEILHRFQL